jgi:hypothetical protein
VTDHPNQPTKSEACRLVPTTPLAQTVHLDRFDFLLLPAFFKAIATACFCGLPVFISVLMFELIVLCDEPFLRGMVRTLCMSVLRVTLNCSSV